VGGVEFGLPEVWVGGGAAFGAQGASAETFVREGDVLFFLDPSLGDGIHLFFVFFVEAFPLGEFDVVFLHESSCDTEFVFEDVDLGVGEAEPFDWDGLVLVGFLVDHLDAFAETGRTEEASEEDQGFTWCALHYYLQIVGGDQIREGNTGPDPQ